MNLAMLGSDYSYGNSPQSAQVLGDSTSVVDVLKHTITTAKDALVELQAGRISQQEYNALMTHYNTPWYQDPAILTTVGVVVLVGGIILVTAKRKRRRR